GMHCIGVANPSYSRGTKNSSEAGFGQCLILICSASEHCPPKIRAASTKPTASALRLCRGLSVPFTVSVHGEPGSSGRTGHASVKLRHYAVLDYEELPSSGHSLETNGSNAATA